MPTFETQKKEREPIAAPGNIRATRLAFLFLVFFLIALGLGYPVLNRYDPRLTPGLSDVKIYAQMASDSSGVESASDRQIGHLRFRVLIPWLARPIASLARGHVGTWDPVMFSLLVVDSLFVAGTAVLIVLLGARHLGNSAVGLLGAFVYLVNFAVPNLRLVGLVDAGEGFFLLAMLWALAESRLWAVPLIAVPGTLTKESFLPLGMAFGVGWLAALWVSSRGTKQTAARAASRSLAIWLVLALAASVTVFLGLHRAIEGRFVNPLVFGIGLHRGHDYLSHFLTSLADRQLWYIFVWLLPTAIPRLKSVPRPWLWASGAACAIAFALDAYYGGAPGTVGRALFTAAGPVLSLSSAMLLVGILD